MVGNDTQNRPGGKNVGMKTYIVTDYLIGSTEAAKADGYGKLSSLRLVPPPAEIKPNLETPAECSLKAGII